MAHWPVPNKDKQYPFSPSLTLSLGLVSQIGRVSISSPSTTTTSLIEDYADSNTPAVPAVTANAVLIRPSANERRSNLKRPPHPSCRLPQTQEGSSIHRQLQRGSGNRSRRRNPRCHRHRGHSPAFNRLPSNIANPRILHLLSTTRILRPSPNQSQGCRRSSGHLIRQYVHSYPPPSTQETQAGSCRRNAPQRQETDHEWRPCHRPIETMGVDKRCLRERCTCSSYTDVIVQHFLTGAYFPPPQSSNDHPSCDDKEGHYIIVPDDMIARRCKFLSLLPRLSFYLTPVRFRPNRETLGSGNIRQGCGGD